jgi:4-amino-4-deoxy-L-arabinose transferase-like glycosyltransferase
MGLSLVLKLTAALLTENMNPDGTLYITSAQEIASGRFKDAMELYSMPLYPLLINLFHVFIPDYVLAARSISVLASVLTLVPLYLLTTDLFERRVAFWACVAFAVAPFPNQCATDVLRDPPFWLFFTWTVYLARRAMESRRLIFFFLTSLFTGISILFRIEGTVLIVLFLLSTLYLSVRKPEARRDLLMGALIWALIPLLSLATLYLLLGSNWASFNRIEDIISWSGGLAQLDFLHNHRLIYEKLKSLQYSLPWPHLEGNFAETARHYILLIYLIGLIELFIRVLYPIFIFPLVWGFRTSFGKNSHFVLCVSAFFFLLAFYILISKNSITRRFLFPSALLLYPWIGLGLEQILSYSRQFAKPRLLAALFALLLCAPASYYWIRPLVNQDSAVKTAGEWLAGRPELQDARIASNDGKIPFYAGLGRRFQSYEKSDLSGVEQFALSSDIDVLIIRTPVKRRGSIPEFKHFKKIIEFKGHKEYAAIYFSLELAMKSPDPL